MSWQYGYGIPPQQTGMPPNMQQAPSMQIPQQQQQFQQQQMLQPQQQQQMRFQPTGQAPPQFQQQQPQPTGLSPGPPQQQQRPAPQQFQVPQPTGLSPAMAAGVGAGGSPMGGLSPPPPSGLSSVSPQPQQPMYTGLPNLQPASLPNFSQNSLPTSFLGSFMPSQNAPRPALTPQFTSMPPNSIQFSQPALSTNLQQPVQPQSAPPPVPWALTPEERKNYDQIFRAWDANSTGFISGTLAKEVFGQSGLDRNDLMAIWNLADVNNRGKLNLAEFHVAMGLIYRRLNGNPIPEQLPPELIPPSSKDLDNSVDFLKDLLRHDNNARNAAAASDPELLTAPVSYAKSRSFHQPSTSNNNNRKDATVYKYDESSSGRSVYKPSSRHIDRNQVRASSDEPPDDLADMKRQLDSSQRLLDSSRQKEDEDEALEQEKDDLMYSIRRVQSDIEHLAAGRRSEARDAERRKLDRKLDELRYEQLPKLERKIEDREREKASKRREEARRRDQRNDDRYRRFGGSSDRDRDYYDDGGYRPSSRHDDDYYSRGYFKGSYEDDDRQRSRDHHGYDRDRDRDYDYDRRSPRPRSSPRSPPRSRSSSSAAPPPPPPPASNDRPQPPPPPPSAPPASSSTAPAPTPSPKPTKDMSPEERKAYMQSEAQRRIQERLRALGVTSGPTTTTSSGDSIDSTVQQRLEEEKRAAAERAAKADAETSQREKERQARLERERQKDEDFSSSSASQPKQEQQQHDSSSHDQQRQEAEQERRRIDAENEKVQKRMSAIKIVQDEVDQGEKGQAADIARQQLYQEQEEMRKREEMLRKQKEESAARLRKLEEEYEASRRAEEEFLKKKQAPTSSTTAATSPKAPKPPAPPAPTRSKPPAPKPPPARSQAPAPPPPPPVPAAKNDDWDAPAPRSPAPPAPAPAPAPPPPPARTAPPPPPPLSETPAHKGQEQASPASPSQAPASEPAPAQQSPPPPPAPPAPPAPAAQNSSSESKNPFHRLGAGNADKSGTSQTQPQQPQPPATSANSSDNNPFFKPQSAAASSGPAPTPPPPPPPPPSDDWDAPTDKGEESSDDEGPMNRQARAGLASALFGGIMPPSRPTSTNIPSPQQTPKPPSAPTSPEQDSSVPAPPVPAPPPPPPPPAAAPPQPSNDDAGAPPPPAADGARGALLSQIQMGTRLKKAVTNDRSSSSLAGKVVDDGKPDVSPPQPAHTVSPVPINGSTSQDDHHNGQQEQESKQLDKRQSVDWYGSLAAEAAQRPAPTQASSTLPSFKEEEEDNEKEDSDENYHTPELKQQDDQEDSDINFSKKTRSRTLYPYSSPPDRPDDLNVEHDIVLNVHPAYSNNDWVYGIVESDGRKGWLPALYVESVENPTKCLALYDYAPRSEGEMKLVSGSTVTVVDQSEQDWWKIIQGSNIGNVPASYLSTTEGSDPKPVIEKEEETATIPSAQVKDDPAETKSISSSDGNSSDDDLKEDDSSDSDIDDEETRKIREAERLKVLEAAGLLRKPTLGRSGGTIKKSGSVIRRKQRPPPPPPGNDDINNNTNDDTNSKVLNNNDGQNESSSLDPNVSKPLPFSPQDSSQTDHQDSSLPQDRNNMPSSPGKTNNLSNRQQREGSNVDDDVDEEDEEEEEEEVDHEEDAYQRYERLRREKPAPAMDRNSLIIPSNKDSLPSLPTLGSKESGTGVGGNSSSGTSSMSTATSTAGKGATSGFLTWVTSGISRASPNIDRHRISTPTPTIVRVDDGPSPEVSNDNGNSGGSSWAAQIDAGVVNELPAQERKRQEAIWELIQTESTYLRSLQLIVQEFYAKLQDVLSEKSSKVIFANIEDILLFNTVFSSDLEDRLNSSGLFVDTIGDVIMNHVPRLDIYWMYCSNEPNAQRTLTELKTHDENVKSILEKTRVNDLELEHFLLQPMQRLTRYPLLFGQILKYTDSDHADYEVLQKCLSISERVLSSINESIREQENEERLRTLSDTLKLPGVNFGIDLTGHPRLNFIEKRLLLKEGALTKGVRAKRLDTYLFNDMIIFAIGNEIYKDPIPLEECAIRDRGLKDDLSFQLKHRGVTHQLRAPSARQCSSWVKEIKAARKGCLDAAQEERNQWSKPDIW